MKRAISIFCITFLLFSITAPCIESCFVYADDEPVEEMTDVEKVKAGITVYLNKRHAFLTSTFTNELESIQLIMQNWVDSYDFWKNTEVGSLAELASNVIIRYRPFRISLKGTAILAYDDLVNWLAENGYLENADQASGGATEDDLYNGYIYNGQLITLIEGNHVEVVNNPETGVSGFCNKVSPSHIDLGTVVDHMSGDVITSRCLVQFPNYQIDNADQKYAGTAQIDVTVASNWTKRISFDLRGYNWNMHYADFWNLVNSGLNDHAYPCVTGAGNIPIYNALGTTYRGGVYLYKIDTEAANRLNLGIITNNGSNFFFKRIEYHTISAGIPSGAVKLETNDFVKQPDVPDPEEEVEYTPEDKDTGDTYNTYNEYVNNYIQKKTVIREVTNTQPGGTTPPWNGGNSGTATPDSNGGFNLNLPDITVPDLNIDWNINGLQQKFPFSIPWDLVAFFTVLNAPPETPELQGQIDLGIVNWDIDWDLHDFDNLARLLRNLEFIGFCLALILITRSIIKG